MRFSGGSDGKESACNARDPGVGNGNLLQYSCLEESMGRGARQVTAHRGRKESDMIEQLSTGSVLQ